MTTIKLSKPIKRKEFLSLNLDEESSTLNIGRMGVSLDHGKASADIAFPGVDKTKPLIVRFDPKNPPKAIKDLCSFFAEAAEKEYIKSSE